ncbi:MAG TPA: hypothetical protein VHH34_09185 [Pseudonocardiaceae bacterium]|nr:hypothetical protein [Pseudonocardiaceae bacterium]
MGVLDAGSNTVRLEIADAVGAVPLPVHTAKYRLRLAEHIDPCGRLPDKAIRRLSDAVAAARTEAAEWGVKDPIAFATAIVRDAPNRDQVLQAVQERAGLELAVMSGQREAELTFQAARAWMGWRAGPMVVFDIGGGSLEVAFGRTGLPDFATSTPLGAGRLTREHFGRKDPPPPKAVKALRRQVRHQLRDVADRIRWEAPLTAVGTSRTFQQLARLSGAPPASRGPYVPRRLHRADLRQAVRTLEAMPAADRAHLPGITHARARQALAGSLVAHTAMKLMNIDHLTVCPWALRDGVLLDHLAHRPGHLQPA